MENTENKQPEEEVQVDFLQIDQDLEGIGAIPVQEENENEIDQVIDLNQEEQYNDTIEENVPSMTTTEADEVIAKRFKCDRAALDFLNMVYNEDVDYKNVIEPLYYGTINYFLIKYGNETASAYNKIVALVVSKVQEHLANIIHCIEED